MKYSFTTSEQAPAVHWKLGKTVYPVRIPNLDGDGFSQTIEVEIDAWQTLDGDLVVPADVKEKLEELKARCMGLLSPVQMKELRESFGLSQNEMSQALQLGGKTWHRWETGKERPSRSLNILLQALYDGRIDLAYLRQLQTPVSAKDLVVPSKPESTSNSQDEFTLKQPVAAEELACAA